MAKLKKNVVDDLVSDVVKTINSKFSKSVDKSAYFLTDSDISDVNRWIPTGCDLLDMAISNKPAPNAGIPVGRITEITGLEASGKSLLAAYALKSTQMQGGLAIYIDTEAAISREYLTAIGVDVEKLVYIPMETLEDIFDTIEATIVKVRNSDKDVLVTIVVDSIMGATTKKELSAEHGKDGFATEKALVLSKAMRKITNMISKQNICLVLTNQLRIRLNASFGDKYTTSGGKAVAFHSSVRIRLISTGKIKADIAGVERVVGIQTKAVVQKNRLGPPLKTINYDIYFDSGIDNYGGWLTELKNYNQAKSGAFWSLYLEYESIKETDSNGNPIVKRFDGDIVNINTGELKSVENQLKFRSKEFGLWMDANPKLREFVYGFLCDRIVMEYSTTANFGIDDVVVDNDDEMLEND